MRRRHVASGYSSKTQEDFGIIMNLTQELGRQRRTGSDLGELLRSVERRKVYAKKHYDGV